MVQASVGFQCPECVAQGRGTQRQPKRPGLGRQIGRSSATMLLIGAIVIAQMLDSVLLGRVSGLLAYSGIAVQSGQVWRLLTYVVVSGNLLSLLLNGVVLWLFGRAMEDIWGKWRFLATFLLSGLGGAALLFAAGPLSAVMAGTSTGIIGLLAANAAVKLRAHDDVRPDLVMLAILVGFGVFSVVWAGIADLGAILAGGAAGWLWGARPKGQVRRRGSMSATDRLHVAGTAGIVLGCLIVAGIGFLIH